MKGANVTDPIADLLTRIRNASNARHAYVEIPASKMKVEIARILKEENFIENYQVVKSKPVNILRIKLRYLEGREPVIKGIRRISKPGLRIYAKRDELPRVLKGLGVAIISTSKGLMTDRDARAQGYGGEVICYVW